MPDMRNLETLRGVLVKERRKIVQEAINETGDFYRSKLVPIQEQIEAVDRALEDERKLNPSYQAFSPRGG